MDVSAVYRHGVFTISPDESLFEAARRMRGKDVSSLMVLDGEKFVGIITERDLTRAIATGELAATMVGDQMTDHPVTVSPGSGIRQAAAEMLELDVRHLPVAVGGDVVGMVSLRDLLGVLVEDTSP
jgi:CBS domain-containing protein